GASDGRTRNPGGWHPASDASDSETVALGSGFFAPLSPGMTIWARQSSKCRLNLEVVRRRIDHDARGDGQVQAVGAAPHGNLDVHVAGSGQLVGQARLFVAHQD